MASSGDPYPHCHRAASDCKQPLTYLILIGDGLHNFLGGLAVGAAFLLDVRLGIMTWLAAAAHEIPQELGDFAVLIQGGWHKRPALFFNVVSLWEISTSCASDAGANALGEVIMVHGNAKNAR